MKDETAKSGYHNVEFASRKIEGFRNRIIDLGEVNKLADRYNRFEAFTSMYFYSDDLLSYMEKNLNGNKPSVSGYDGKVYSNYLFFDIDSHDLEKSQKVSQDLVSFLYDKWRIPETGVTVSFSGNKGFHLGLGNCVFGEIKPDKSLNQVYAEIRKELPELARIKDKDCVDQAISDRTRLWRLVNTKHQKTGLYKIPLKPDELFNLSVSETRGKAKSPQPVIFTDETGLVPKERTEPIGEAMELYSKAVKELKKRRSNMYKPRFMPEIDDSRPLKNVLCPARHKLLNSNVSVGRRNQSALLLASSLREAGYSQKKANEVILKWNVMNDIGLNEYELRNVVDSAYRVKNGYHFGCSSFGEYCSYKDKKICKKIRNSYLS